MIVPNFNANVIFPPPGHPITNIFCIGPEEDSLSVRIASLAHISFFRNHRVAVAAEENRRFAASASLRLELGMIFEFLKIVLTRAEVDINFSLK